MGYHGEDRHGGDRWRDRDQGNWNRDRDYAREQGRGGSGGYGSGGDDRGFFDRAGDEVRSWFGDDDAQRRREMDQRRWEQEQRMSGRRDNDSGPGTFGGGGFGTGWGNQEGRSWNRERPGERGDRDGWFSDSVGGERGRRRGGSGAGYGMREREPWGAGGFGGDDDRGSGYGSGGSSRYSGAMRDQGGRGLGGDIHDPHYSEWRRRQIEDLDRDYEEYRREHQSKFEQEFGSWRSKRATQRQSLGKAMPHMEVVGSDGSHVGTVDKVAGDRIILTKSDENAGGLHHSVPCGWVEAVADKVTLNKTAEEAMDAWRSEERGRALFEREDSGSEGPHALNRSFSGTYSDRDS